MNVDVSKPAVGSKQRAVERRLGQQRLPFEKFEDSPKKTITKRAPAKKSDSVHAD